MLFRVARIAGAFLIAVLLGACNGGGDDVAGATDEPVTDTTDSTDRTAPTSTETSVTTTTVGVTVTDPQTGEDFRKLAAELWEVWNQAAITPSMELLNRAIDAGCECYADESRDIQLLLDGNYRWSGRRLDLRGVHFNQQTSPRDAVATAIVWRPVTLTILDSKGMVFESREQVDPTGLSIGLFKGDDGLWRIGHLAALDDLDPSVKQQIIEEGVP